MHQVDSDALGVDKTGEYCGGRERMLRLLALLFLYAATLLSTEPASASGNHLDEMSNGPAVVLALAMAPAGDETRCASERACCMAMHAPCQASYFNDRWEGPQPRSNSSRVTSMRNDCLRSHILGRDPPVPRSRSI